MQNSQSDCNCGKYCKAILCMYLYQTGYEMVLNGPDP